MLDSGFTIFNEFFVGKHLYRHRKTMAALETIARFKAETSSAWATNLSPGYICPTNARRQRKESQAQDSGVRSGVEENRRMRSRFRNSPSPVETNFTAYNIEKVASCLYPRPLQPFQPVVIYRPLTSLHLLRYPIQPPPPEI